LLCQRPLIGPLRFHFGFLGVPNLLAIIAVFTPICALFLPCQALVFPGLFLLLLSQDLGGKGADGGGRGSAPEQVGR